MSRAMFTNLNAADWYGIPNYMRDGIAEYVLRGRSPGGFLTAVFENNLCEAFSRADDQNSAAMRYYAMLLYNDVPLRARGSPANVKAWQEAGGLEGLAIRGLTAAGKEPKP